MVEAVEQGFTRLTAEVLDEARAFPYLVRLEQEAVDFRIFDMRLVPGLLQTEDYARAAICAGDPAPRFDVEARLAERMRRQDVLGGENPPRVRVVLDEAVLHRQIAGPAAQREQLARLLNAGHVEIQVHTRMGVVAVA